jgi:hypothetical protein
MEFTEVLWGAIVIVAGVFISVYGSLLFKFALAAMGFSISFIAAWTLLDSQDDSVRILVSLAAGAIGAFLLYALARFGLYIAGAILGLVIAVVVAGIIEIVGSRPDGILMWILAIGGIASGGVLGPRLGQLIVVLATSAAGAYLIIAGVQVWYASRLGDTLDDPTQTLAQKLTLTVFLIFFSLSALSQFNSGRLMQRVLN